MFIKHEIESILVPGVPALLWDFMEWIQDKTWIAA